MSRKLKELVSVGKRFIEVFEDLGITEVSHLVDKDADQLFDQYEQLTNDRVDPCVLDTFRCAIEQARDPELPEEKKHWPYWSKVRKGQISE